jgi:hypothetical protein
VSSKSRTPLHSRLHPCSGWCAKRRADSRSADSAGGHGGWCWHMGRISRSVVVMAVPRGDKSVGTQCCPPGVIPQGFRCTASHPLRTHHPRGRFIPTGLSLWVVRSGRIGLVRSAEIAFRLVGAGNCSYERAGKRAYPASQVGSGVRGWCSGR